MDLSVDLSSTIIGMPYKYAFSTTVLIVFSSLKQGMIIAISDLSKAKHLLYVYFFLIFYS